MFQNYEDYKKAPTVEKLQFWAKTTSWEQRIALDMNTTITRLDMLNDLRKLCREAEKSLLDMAEILNTNLTRLLPK